MSIPPVFLASQELTRLDKEYEDMVEENQHQDATTHASEMSKYKQASRRNVLLLEERRAQLEQYIHWSESV